MRGTIFLGDTALNPSHRTPLHDECRPVDSPALTVSLHYSLRILLNPFHVVRCRRQHTENQGAGGCADKMIIWELRLSISFLTPSWQMSDDASISTRHVGHSIPMPCCSREREATAKIHNPSCQNPSTCLSQSTGITSHTAPQPADKRTCSSRSYSCKFRTRMASRNRDDNIVALVVVTHT